MFFLQLNVNAQDAGQTYSVRTKYNIKYAQKKDYKNRDIKLYLDFYFPNNDSLKNTPILFFAHGGGFVLGNKNAPVSSTICYRMAQLGYASISINYRLGYNTKLSKSEEAKRTLVRAMEDFSDAIQFVKDSLLRHNIDTNNIIIGGSSAGAIIALELAYNNENKELIKASEQININPLKFKKHNYQSVVSLCGAMSTPIKKNKDIPLISVHGTNDKLVPFYKGVSEPIRMFGFQHIPKDTLYGDAYLINQLNNKEKIGFLHTFKDAKHIPYEPMLYPNKYEAYLDSTIFFIAKQLNKFNKKTIEVTTTKQTSTIDYNINTKNILVISPVNKSFKKITAEITLKNRKKINLKTYRNYGYFFSKKEINFIDEIDSIKFKTK